MNYNSNNKELIVLQHGFTKSGRDMGFLKKYFESEGYRTLTPDLPLFFDSLEDCEKDFEKIFFSKSGNYSRVHFVGHSMGGLVIRLFLSRNNVRALGRCVLTGTPNRGTDLVGIVNNHLKPLMKIIKPYNSLKPGGVKIQSPMNLPYPEIGVIAGNKGDLLLGLLLKGEHDGRVPVSSVPFEGMKEFIVLPLNHDELHHRKETASFILKFIRSGSFGNTIYSR